MYNFLEETCKSNLESVILNIAEKYLTQINLVLSVPGISTWSAIAVISEIGTDMSVFPTSKHLCSWTGLTPQNNESAGKKKTTRISRAGNYIKPLLVQCALAAIRDKKHPEVRNRYLAIKNPEIKKGYYCYCKNVAYRHLQYLKRERTLQSCAISQIRFASCSQ